MRGVLGDTLVNPATGYTFVYGIEVILLFATLIAVGPLVRPRDGERSATTAKFSVSIAANSTQEGCDNSRRSRKPGRRPDRALRIQAVFRGSDFPFAAGGPPRGLSARERGGGPAEAARRHAHSRFKDVHAVGRSKSPGAEFQGRRPTHQRIKSRTLAGCSAATRRRSDARGCVRSGKIADRLDRIHR